MVATPANSENITGAGLVKFDGTNTYSAVTTTQFDVLVGAASNGITSVGTGSAGQILQSGGNAANPAYSTATYPATAGTTNTLLLSNGTNFVNSTPTFPNASATSGKFIRSDGTNWIASTPTLPTTGGTTSTLLRSDGTNWVNTTGFTVDSTGRMQNTAQPLFTAFLSTNPTNATGDGTTFVLVYDTADINQGASYNTGTGTFTAPVAGTYLFSGSVNFSSLGSAHTHGQFAFNSTAHSWFLMDLNAFAISVGGFLELSASTIQKMAAGDTAHMSVIVSGGTKSVGITSFTTWQGFLIA